MTGLGSSCGACKFLRRKCTSECVFAPYFCYDQANSHFAAIHKVFGASNFSKLLLHLPVHCRSDAATTVSYEALARMWDPIYGCVAHVFALQQQVASLQEEIQVLGNQMANLADGAAGCASLDRGAFPDWQAGTTLHHGSLNTIYHPYQSAATVNQACCTAGSQDFESEVNVQVPSPYRWEGPTTSCDSILSPIEQLLDEIQKDIFAYCSFMNSEQNTN